MKASISFNIYKDFSKYLNLEDELEPSYDMALQELNRILKNLVANDELIFTYKGKQVKIHLPITINNIGNIFSESLNDNETLWNDVEIPCKINCKQEDFKSNELQVEKCPIYFDPIMIYY